MMITVALAPLASVPRLQVTVVEPLQVPWLAVADTKLTVAGSVSVRETLSAAPGPLFRIVNPYSNDVPTATGFGDANLLSARSAPLPVPTMSVRLVNV